MTLVTTWVLDEIGDVTGYTERGDLVRRGYPGCKSRGKAEMGAERALILWAAESRGRLRSAGLRLGVGGEEGLDEGLLAALRVERFFESRGRSRRWAPLMVYGGEPVKRVVPETWEAAVSRLGGSSFGVAPWDFSALAELVTAEVLEELEDWLLGAEGVVLDVVLEDDVG